ncbi:RND family transporter [Mycolicibacterium mucogenicum]|uniref:MMPL/RND family transporter n=1 Tax=Mycolicibacterium mucogenicum TaxID=56689 RepID=UPI00226AED8E|nr:RND family transporter [Mycolicibacterium mucogenicum]MCX8563114.1 RND family transporter [Mycolicibacterium mucogenicum]
MWDVIARFCSRFAVLIIGLWVLAAAAGNLLVPQVETTAHNHARGFLPADAPVNLAGVQMDRQFHDGSGGNLNYLVLEGDHPLGAPERAYYARLLSTLRADTEDMDSVMDLWSDPVTAAGAQSTDGKAVYTMLRIRGELGAAKANAALDAVRRIVAAAPAPQGLHAYVTGPGATIADELSAIDRQMLMITGVTVVLIAVLLFVVYRSVITAAIPLLTVGLGLGVARGVVAFLGERDLIEVSIFSVSLLAAMVLGAATDYGIFLLGRYHEQRRAGVDHEDALAIANRSVAPVIAASGLTIAAALSCLLFAQVGMLRSAGLPCAIGILTGMVASLTLLPAFIGLAGRHGLAQPRRRAAVKVPGRSWRRVGTVVARWPGPVLVASSVVLLVCALPVAGIRLGFDELAAQPDSTPANRGYQAMDRHFPANRLLPEIVSIETDHDLRNPAGVIAVERVARKIMEIPGIRMVQSASRPAGSLPEQAALTDQAGTVADQLDDGVAQLSKRLGAVNQLSATLDQFSSAITQLQNGLGGSVRGLGQLGSGIDAMHGGMQQLRDNVTSVSQYMDPLRGFTTANPNCAGDAICSLVLKVVEPMDSVVAATGTLTDSTRQFGAGTTDMARSLTGAQASVRSMRAAVDQLGSVTAQLTKTVGETRGMFSGLTDYLRGVRADFQDSSEGGFYLPQRAWQDPRFQRAAGLYFAPDGRSTRLLVYGDGKVFGTDGALRSPEILAAVRESTKEGTLVRNSVYVTGFGTGTAELRGYVSDDFLLLAGVALALVFLIILIMLRSPVAAAVVIGTVVVSYVSAVGVSAFIWQALLGKELHWAVPSIALIALVAVGADYNLLLTMRLREEISGGLRTGMIRTFGGTGGVVTTAGLVFGITMFAMLSSDVLSIEQVGTTIGVGLLIDTLIVRTFVVPGIAGLLGRWFWWSPVPLVRGVLSRTFTRRPARPRRDLPLIAGTTPGRDALQGAAG